MVDITEARLAQMRKLVDESRNVPLDVCPNLALNMARCLPDALTQIETLKAELTAVDVALGNRSVFDSLVGRAAKINAACARAGQADRAEAERDRLKTEIETLTGENDRLMRVLGQMDALGLPDTEDK